MNLSWDETFIELALVIARRSKDPSSKVGACIVDANKRIISLGYKENAILFAQRNLHGTTLYVTHMPCPRCAAKIVQVGIRSVVFLPQASFEERWANELRVTREIFDQAKVAYRYLIL
jgi:dCMP deaminase